MEKTRQLLLYNSLSRKKELLQPLDPNLIKIYVCGPTIYDRPHIGNARSVVVYDLLYRLLIQLFGQEKILYVRNITDIDDKIINRAAEEKIAISELTARTLAYFQQDMQYLACLSPNIEPKATEHVPVMIELINRLLARGVAYRANNHIYFDVRKVTDYYHLSGRNFEKNFDSVRIEAAAGKKNAEDFVLWKPAAENSESFSSPFGLGRPGWHIECSAMSYKYLGTDFDIHGGGADLIFPHHTNEIAQSCMAFPGSTYAKLWMHNGFLTVDGEKMSKSLNNFITVADLRAMEVEPEVARLFLLSTHYRKPVDYNKQAIAYAKQTLSYWYRAVEAADLTESQITLPEEFLEQLLNDLNISGAIKIINQFAKKIYTSNEPEEKKKLAAKLLASARFLGLMHKNPTEWFGVDDQLELARIERLMQERKEAKLAKNWLKADQIREKLQIMQIEIEDRADGVSLWKKK